jgi:signal transduction histidine kinase/AraC-like DNA-binding protein
MRFQEVAPLFARPGAPARCVWRRLLASVSLWLCTSVLVAAPPAYVHEFWSVRDGLPVNSVNQIIQSRSGYLWLATFDGLVRFDGARFEVHTSSNTPGLGHQRLVGVLETDDDKLLLSSDGGVLQLFDPISARATVLWTSPGGKQPLVWDGPDGEIWISLEPGLGRLRGDRIEALTQAPLTQWQISALGFGAAGQIWVGTLNAGAWAWAQGDVRQLATPAQLTLGRIFALAEDGAGTLWLGGEHGVDLIDATGVRALYDGDQQWRVSTQHLQRNRDGSLLIASETGPYQLHDGQLRAIDPEDRRRVPAQGQVLAVDPDWLISASAVFRNAASAHPEQSTARELLFRLDDLEATRFTYTLRDRGGSLWLATSGAGLHRLRPAAFSTLGEAQGLSAREVYPLHQSADGAVWIGTQKGGLNRYLDGRIEAFGSADGLLDDNIRAIASDGDGRLWVATEEAGLFQRQADGQFQPQPQAPIGGARVKALFLDRDGVLWAGAESGLFWRDADGAWQRHAASDALPGCTIRVIRQADDGSLWIGSHRCGLARLLGASLQRYSADNGDIGNHVRDIHFADNSVLVATEDRGVGRLQWSDTTDRPSMVSLRAAHGLLSDGIHQILPDGHGWLWMSTNRGIFRVRQRELLAAADRIQAGAIAPALAIDSYAEAAGLRNREANGGVQSTALMTRAGELWFATQDGVAIVDPEPVRLARPVQPLIEHVSSGDQRWRADQPLKLAAESRSFRIDYTELLQMDGVQTRFRHRLLGYDDDWIAAGGNRSASYTKVPPGDYEFQVQAWSGGAWSSDDARLRLTLQPYFTETSSFQVLLLLSGLTLLWLAYRARVGWLNAQRRELQRQVDIRTLQLAAGKAAAEQASQLIAAQAEQLREVDRQKSRFFDDLAHELRTPLTLILGPLKDVQRAASDAPQPAIDGAIRNSEVLLDLTNQLLDLARLQGGKLKLERSRENLVELLRASADRFSSLAVLRGIGFRWRLPAAPLFASLDLRHAGKIVDNLLSNAFKFTPAGGDVELVLQVDGDGMARIDVTDTGSGIAPEHLPHVFDRFYQTEDAGSRLQPGTGIGLALVHDLTGLHDGRLEVRSTQGSGTTFSVFLPLCEPAADADVVVEELVPAAAGARSRANASAEPVPPIDESSDQTTILVVDDHAQIRAHVRSHLAPKYRVIEAADGIEALALARERLPDLIVADISMPLLDGYGLCAQIRRDAELDWLPIILLTARAGLENRLEGLRAAADDYLTKPFDAEELRARVDNLIALRRRLRDHYAQPAREAAQSSDVGATAAQPTSGAELDDDASYRAHLLAVINERMADEFFKVAELADAMGQDRSYLFRRVREVTGQAPSDLIRDLRLQRAAELLQAEAGPISEIAYAVGFSSVAYFTKCFRERYGRTPGQCRGVQVTPIAA